MIDFVTILPIFSWVYVLVT